MAVLAVLAATDTSGRAQAPAVPALLGDTVSGPVEAPARLDTLQSRLARPNLQALEAGVIDLLLTSGRIVRAERDRRETTRNGAQVWAGHLPGVPFSSVTLVALDGVLQGAVRTLDAAYSIEPADGGPLHVVREVDVDATGFELAPHAPPDGVANAAADAPPMAGDDGSMLDVLVMYTPAARTSAGGTDAAVQARIALGISESNSAYGNSGVVPRLRLVGAELTPYTESGDLSTDLSRFRTAGDGHMDEVHGRRDALGADLMVLIAGDVAGGACGVGYIMTSLSSSFAPWAFSVTAYPCISPNYTFAHELGHNMGSAHAPEDGASQASLYPYSFGYKHPSNLFRTVMAYNCTGGCPRVLHFSNPNVLYSSAPTGTVAQHNNALSINNAASTLANFRQTVGGGTTPTITAIGNVTIAEDAATSPIAFTVGDAETAAASLAVTAVSTNTALVPNTSAALALGGSGANRTLVVTPVANQSGTASITVTVNDGSRTASRTFTLTVTAVNDAPTILRSPVSATIVNGASAQTTVTISDIDTAGSALSLSIASSNTALLPNANVGFSVTSTTANSRTLQVTMTPAVGQSGLATVTLTGSDGSTPAVTTFALTVTVPAPPTIGSIAAQTTPEDSALAVPFAIGDPDTPLASLVVQASATNAGLVPAGGLVLSGAGASRTLTITPAANQTGASTITIAVSDGTTTATASFSLNVTSVNDPPVYAPGAPSAVSTLVSTATTFPVTLTDVDTAGAILGLSGTTTNTAVLAAGGIQIASLSSTTSSATFSVTLTPVAGATGTAAVVLSASDSQASVTRTVQVSVTATPAAPDAPTVLNATAGAATLNLTWTPAATGSTPISYAVYVGTSSGATTLPVQTTTSTSMAVAVTSGDTYYARVHSRNGFGESVPSPEAVATVTVPHGKPGKPPKPRVWTSSRTVMMDWEAPLDGDPVTNYSLEVGTAPGVTNLVVVPLAAARSFSAGGVPDGTFWLRVRATNAWGTSDPSEDVGLVMGPSGGCVGLPFAPTALGSSTSGATVSLAWTAPGIGIAPTGYVLYAGSGPGRADLATFSTGSTLTGWSGAAPPGVYYVRVAARTACGAGPASNEVAVSVGGAVAPGPPTQLSASLSGQVLTLVWSAPASAPLPSSYVVEVGSASGLADVAAIDSGTVATSISGSAPSGRYYVRVRSRTGGMIGAASNEAVVDVP